MQEISRTSVCYVAEHARLFHMAECENVGRERKKYLELLEENE